jgi:hypothetical protein
MLRQAVTGQAWLWGGGILMIPGTYFRRSRTEDIVFPVNTTLKKRKGGLRCKILDAYSSDSGHQFPSKPATIPA